MTESTPGASTRALLLAWFLRNLASMRAPATFTAVTELRFNHWKFLVFLAAATACGGAAAGPGDADASGNAGRGGTSGTATGGTHPMIGGTSSTVDGGSSPGGTTATGGTIVTNGGQLITGGTYSTGSVANGGRSNAFGGNGSVGGASNSGGKATGGNATSGGSFAVGGTTNAGGKNTGGTNSSGTNAGGKATGGGASTAGSASTGGSACNAIAAPPPICSNDSQCPNGQFCDTQNCGPSCRCVGDQMVCTDVCRHSCVPITCTPAGSAFRSQFTAVNCDVVARVNADATQILGYRVVCGNTQTVTIDSLKAKLLPSARVNWSQSTSYGSASDAAYLFVHSSGPYDVVAFGMSTGLQLFEFTDSTTPSMFGTWSPASDIDGNCIGPIPTFQSLGPWDASYSGQAILELVHEKGLIGGVTTAFGGYRAISVVRASLPAIEYLVIVSSFVHV